MHGSGVNKPGESWSSLEEHLLCAKGVPFRGHSPGKGTIQTNTPKSWSFVHWSPLSSLAGKRLRSVYSRISITSLLAALRGKHPLC